MNLLLDENLSPRLVGLLAPRFACMHVNDALGLGRWCADSADWEFARRRGLLIVTKDDDFVARAIIRGAPPKVVWLDVGNAGTHEIADLLLGAAGELAAFRDAEGVSVLGLPLRR